MMTKKSELDNLQIDHVEKWRTDKNFKLMKQTQIRLSFVKIDFSGWKMPDVICTSLVAAGFLQIFWKPTSSKSHLSTEKYH